MGSPILELRSGEQSDRLSARLLAADPYEQIQALNIIPMLVDAALEWNCHTLDIDVAQLETSNISALLATLIVALGKAHERGITVHIIAGPRLESVVEIVHLDGALPLTRAVAIDESIAKRHLDFSAFANRRWDRSLRSSILLEP